MPVSTRYETTTPYEALADFMGRLLDAAAAAGEGICWGGATAIGDFGGGGTTYPAFLALVQDDSGRMWPCGSASAVPVEFIESSGACSLYLIPFDDSDLPSYMSGQIGSFSLVAQLTASGAPDDSLLLGAGSVTASAFTTWTEQSGVRRNSVAVGSGKDQDVTLYARNGDANQPALRYQSSGNKWQYSNNGTAFNDVGNVSTGDSPTFGDLTASQYLATGASAGTTLVSFKVTGDANPRFTTGADGKQSWGGGSGAVDTNLYRTASNSLGTDDALSAGGANFITNPNVLYFDGNGDYITLGTGKAPELDSANHFSFSFWANFDDITHTGYYFQKSASGSNRVVILAQASALRFYVNNTNTGYGYFTLTGLVANGEWHHYAAVYDGTQATDATKLVVYLDGVAQTLTFTGAALPSSTADISAANTYLSNTSTNSHQGYLKDFRIYSSSLAAADVTSLFQGSNAVSGMVHRWKANEGTGATTILDSGTNPQNGTLTGGTWQNMAAVGVNIDIPYAPLSLPLSTLPGQGIRFGNDTQLYRSAAGTLYTPGGLGVGGNATLGDASTDTITCTGRLLVRSVSDAGPMTATAGTQREIVFNTSDSKFYGCTVTGSPATWAALN